MRSSKSRNRSKSNRNNRSMGNVINRVFDSSGTEGKVRGTPQQIIDKYTQLARDAQLSGDRVAFENFQQHSEHYQRLFSEAQREQDSRREQQERDNKERPAQRDAERAERAAVAEIENTVVEDAAPAMEVSGADPMAVIDTPQAAAEEEASKPKPRRRRAPKPKVKDAPEAAIQPEVITDAAE